MFQAVAVWTVLLSQRCVHAAAVALSASTAEHHAVHCMFNVAVSGICVHLHIAEAATSVLRCIAAATLCRLVAAEDCLDSPSCCSVRISAYAVDLAVFDIASCTEGICADGDTDMLVVGTAECCGDRSCACAAAYVAQRLSAMVRYMLQGAVSFSCPGR